VKSAEHKSDPSSNPAHDTFSKVRALQLSDDFTFVGGQFVAKIVGYDRMRIAFYINDLPIQIPVRLNGCSYSKELGDRLKNKVGDGLIMVECTGTNIDGGFVISASMIDDDGNSCENLNAWLREEEERIIESRKQAAKLVQALPSQMPSQMPADDGWNIVNKDSEDHI